MASDLSVRHFSRTRIDPGIPDPPLTGTGRRQAALNPMFPEAWGPDKVKALPGYNPDTKEQDRQEAHKLLEAAGYPNGREAKTGRPLVLNYDYYAPPTPERPP